MTFDNKLGLQFHNKENNISPEFLRTTALGVSRECASGGLVEEKCLVGVRVEREDQLENIERQGGGGVSRV